MKMEEDREKEAQKQSNTGMRTWCMWEMRCHISIFRIRSINYETEDYT